MARVLRVFRSGFDEIVLLDPSSDRRGDVQSLSILDPVAAVRRLRELDTSRLAELRDIVIELKGVPVAKDPDLLDNDALLDELARMVGSRRLAIATRQLLFPIVLADVEVVDLADEAPPEEPQAAPPQTFAAFRLVDDRGNPIPERTFSLDLPDGRTVEGVTAEDGRFEVDPVANPGNCVLRFSEPR